MRTDNEGSHNYILMGANNASLLIRAKVWKTGNVNSNPARKNDKIKAKLTSCIYVRN